jgi:hypothetical protein
MALSKIDVANMVTGATPVANGGTGQTTFAAAGLAKRPNAKPIIVNGNMAMSQRTTSTAGVTSTAYGACDRMQLVNNTMGTYTVIQESLTSGAAYEAGFHNAWRIDCTTADSSPAAGDVLYPRYKIESQDLSMFKKGTSEAEAFTIAFWVKSNKTGNAQVNFYDIDNTRLCAGTYTISSANTWEHKVINIAADTTGAWADDNGEGLRIEWRLDSGSNSTSGTTPTAWEAAAAGDRDVAGQLQIARSTDNDWAITGIQLEVGTYTSSTLPPFQHESYGDNLARCQRYYYRINPDADAQASIGEASMYSSSAAFVCLEFPVAMRDSPSLEQTTGTNYFNLNRNSANDNFNTFNNLNASDHTSAHLYISADISGTAGHGARCRFENASARLAFSAEL